MSSDEIAGGDGWARCYKYLKVDLIDGGKDCGILMRRKRPDGRFEYRRMNEEEEDDYVRGEVW